MSRISVIVRKKNLKGKTTHEGLPMKKETASPDISKYLVKRADLSEVDCTEGADVFVPCPDDAALPCSTFQDSVCKTPNCFIHNENDLRKSSKSLSASGESVKSSVENNVNCNNTKKKSKKPTLVARNSQITDFFPVRRSNRKTSVRKMTERNQIIEDFILSGKEEGFQIKEFPDKGRGVISTKAIKRGEFVLEYYGDLIDYEEAKRREGFYAGKENIGCYMFYFKHKNKQYCVDATKETGRLGRLVNHSKKGNLKSRTFLIQESPHLILFASRDILPGEELCYDYGDRRKAALESHPWLAS